MPGLDGLRGSPSPAADALPLDLSHAKVLSWLVERRYLPKDWRNRLLLIQQKTDELAQQQPTSAGLQHERARDYWAALELRDHMADASARTLLGSLTGPAADLNRLVKAYEAKNIYLGEAALTLFRNVNFELPFLRKQVQKAQQQLSDLERRAGDCSKSANAAAANFQQECKAIGIAGSSIAAELHQLPAQLHELLLTALQCSVRVQPLSQALQYYIHFAQHASSSRDCKSSPVAKQQPSLPTLAQTLAMSEAELLIVGELYSTTTDAKDQLSSLLLAKPASNHALTAVAKAAATDAPPVDSAQAADASADIDWDIELAVDNAIEQQVGADNASAGPQIDWDIDMSDEGTDAIVLRQAEHIAAAQMHSAQGWVPRLVQDPALRNALQDDLHELLAFLKQRRLEMDASETSAWAPALPDSLQQVTVSSIAAMLKVLQGAVAALSTDSIKQLLLIQTSPSYKERLVQRLERSAGQESKFMRLAVELNRKHRETQLNLVEDSDKLCSVQKATLHLKQRIEERLCKLLNGRLVNVFGVT